MISNTGAIGNTDALTSNIGIRVIHIRLIFGLLLAVCVTVYPAHAMDAAVVRPDAQQPYLSLSSDLQVGNKGEEVFEVSLPRNAADCGLLWLFDHAELEIKRNRFGNAQLVALPQPGCRHCSPGVVRWYHEPTGHIEFAVHVYRRRVDVPCTEAGTDAEGAAPPLRGAKDLDKQEPARLTNRS